MFYVYVGDKFDKNKDVQHYVSHGLPEDQFSRDFNEDEESDLSIKKIWHDSDSSESYDKYPALVLEAARTRDGMVSDTNSSFYQDFCYRGLWAQAYKKHSEIEYDFLHQQENETSCTDDRHFFADSNLFCHSLNHQINMMHFHISHVEGYQSQCYIRDKIMSLLHDDIHKLPKTNSSSSKVLSQASTCRYFHALGVVLRTTASNLDWLEVKVYSSEDFDTLFDTTLRIQNVMKMLMNNGFFHKNDMYSIFLVFFMWIKEIDSWSNHWTSMFLSEGVKKRFFTKKAIQAFEVYEQQLKAAYGVAPVPVPALVDGDGQAKVEIDTASNFASTDFLQEAEADVTVEEVLEASANADGGEGESESDLATHQPDVGTGDIASATDKENSGQGAVNRKRAISSTVMNSNEDALMTSNKRKSARKTGKM